MANPTRRARAVSQLSQLPRAVTVKTVLTALEQPTLATQSRLSVFFNLTSTLVGGGLLQMGGVFRSSGFLVSTGAVVVLSALCCWTIVLIQRCIERAKEVIPEEDREGEQVDWPIIAQAAFGRGARLCVTAFFLVDLLLAAIVGQVLCASCLQVFLPGVSAVDSLRLSGLVTLCMTALPEEYWSWASMVGILAVFVFLGSIGVTGATMDVDPGVAGYALARFTNLPMVLGVVGSGMMAHSEVATIYSSMRDRAAFPRVASASFTFAAVMYVAVGAVGYAAFADGVQENLIDNIGIAWLRRVAAALFAAKMQVVQPITIAPIAASIEGALLRVLRPRSTKDTPGARARVREAPCCAAASESSTETSATDDAEAGRADDDQDIKANVACVAVLRLTTRCLLVALVVTVAQALGNRLEAITAVAGSLCALGVSVTFPALHYLKLFWPELRAYQKAALVVVATAGAVAQVSGTWSGIAAL